MRYDLGDAVDGNVHAPPADVSLARALHQVVGLHSFMATSQPIYNIIQCSTQ